jgi:hypothetical protein
VVGTAQAVEADGPVLGWTVPDAVAETLRDALYGVKAAQR